MDYVKKEDFQMPKLWARDLNIRGTGLMAQHIKARGCPDFRNIVP